MRLTVSATGFITLTTGEITITANQTNDHGDIELSPALYDLYAVSLSGDRHITVDTENIYNIVVRNNGLLVEDFTIKLMQVGSYAPLLRYYVVDAELELFESRVFELAWTPSQTGIYDIYTYIYFPEDDNPDNNTTNIINVHVRPEGVFPVHIGAWVNPGSPFLQVNAALPFTFSWSVGLVQSIYLASDISDYLDTNDTVGGYINEVVYRLNSAGNIGAGRIVELYVANIALDMFPGSISWIPYQMFTKVFADTLDIRMRARDFQEVTILFDEPFLYTGGNLTFMTHRVARPDQLGEGHWWNGNLWHVDNLPENANRVITAFDDKVYNLSVGYPSSHGFGVAIPNV